MTYSPTDVAIANMALGLAGCTDAVTSVSSTADAVHRAVSTWYEYARRLTLEQHDWNFARKRARLGKSEVAAPADLESGDYLSSFDTESLEVEGEWTYRYRYPDDCVKVRKLENPWNLYEKYPFEVRQQAVLDTVNADKISTISQASPGVVTTSAAHGLSNGDIVFITGQKEYADENDTTGMLELDGRFFKVANKTSTTFELTDLRTDGDVDTSAYTAYDTTNDPGRVVKVLQGVRCILTDQEDVVAVYTKWETDATLYSPAFIDTFANNLAAKMVLQLSGDRLLARELYRYSISENPKNQTRDAQEGFNLEDHEAEWVRGR